MTKDPYVKLLRKKVCTLFDQKKEVGAFPKKERLNMYRIHLSKKNYFST